MEQNQNYVADLERLFHASKDVLITTRANPRLDGLCAMLALSRAFGLMPLTTLSAPGQTRKTVLAVSGRQGSQYTALPGSEHIVSELGLRDFVIGLPGYVDKAVDSVSWYVDQGRLHVVLKSNPAVPMQFDPKLFDPFYAGANFDVVCVIDADTPADLGGLYRQDPGMFTELPVVNISHSAQNTRFGRVNVVEQNVSSASELVYELLLSLQVNLDAETAALLLCGIEDGSESFQRASARTQEIAQELRNIARPALDLAFVRSQAANQPLATHPQGVQPLPGQAAAMPQGYPGVPYPQQYPQPMYPQYPGQMPPQYGGYPQQPVSGYGYMPQPPGAAYPNPYQGPQPTMQPMPQASFPSYHAPVGVPPQGTQQPNQQPQNMYGQPPVPDYGKRDGSGSV